MVTDDEGEKLVPDTVTNEPAGPVEGLRLIPGKTVKVEDAEFEDVSEAVKLCVPDSAVGTLNVAVKPPMALVMEVPRVVVSNVTVTVEDPA